MGFPNFPIYGFMMFHGFFKDGKNDLPHHLGLWDHEILVLAHVQPKSQPNDTTNEDNPS